MKTTMKKATESPKMTGEQVVRKKLNEVNEMLKTFDFAKLQKS